MQIHNIQPAESRQNLMMMMMIMMMICQIQGIAWVDGSHHSICTGEVGGFEVFFADVTGSFYPFVSVNVVSIWTG